MGSGGAAFWRSRSTSPSTTSLAGYTGFAHGHPTRIHDLTYLGTNIVHGISNGAIWSLIAIGYTLVYGIIELINFAHGDVFMIGSMTGVRLLGRDRAGPRHLDRSVWSSACP